MLLVGLLAWVTVPVLGQTSHSVSTFRLKQLFPGVSVMQIRWALALDKMQ